MDDISYTRLKIDKEFKSLIRPLSEAEYLQLEANLIADGCRDPIITWKGFIIDGHNRYEICRKNRLPFKKPFKTYKVRSGVNEKGEIVRQAQIVYAALKRASKKIYVIDDSQYDTA